MSRISNSQSFQINGSSGISIGSVQQSVQAGPEAEAPPAALGRTRLLFVAANPGDTVPLRLDREIQAIDYALTAAGSRDRFDVEQVWLASPADLQRGLLRFSPQILHFSGHGEEEGLIFEAFDTSPPFPGPLEELEGETLPARHLGRLVGLAADKITLAVFNACCSEATAREAARYVPFVVGIPAEIQDSMAATFAWSFYHALGCQKTLRASFELACAQLKHAGAHSTSVPRLFASREDADKVRLLE